MKKNKLQHIKPTKNNFKVPKGYFDSVEDAVLAKLATEKLSNEEGYATPDSYFDTLEDRVLTKIKKENSHQSNLPKQSQAGFTVPENYLKTVEDTITEKINNDLKPVKVINLKAIIIKRIVPFAAAAAILLLIYINYNTKTTSFDSVASSDIEQWIENDLITLDVYEIAEVYNDTELESSVLFEENEVLEYLDGTDIESLLLEN